MKLKQSNLYIGCFIILCSLGSSLASAQNDIIARSAPIISIDISEDKSEATFTDGTGIYIVAVDAFTMKDSLFIDLPPNSFISEVTYTNLNPEVILAKTVRPGYYSKNIFTYPMDSTYMINIRTKTILSRTSNSMRITTGTADNTFAIISETWYKYNFKGEDKYGVRSTDMLIYPEESKHHLQKKVSTFCISPDNSKMAILYHEEYSAESKQLYSLEIRNLPEFTLIGTQPITLNCEVAFFNVNGAYHTYCLDPSLHFDDKSNYLLLEKPYSRGNEDKAYKAADFLQFFNCKNGNLLETVPSIDVLKIGAMGGRFWTKAGNTIIQFDIESKEKIIEIWANLTPFSSIDYFEIVDTNYILITGRMASIFTNTTTGIYKYSLKDEAAYSTIKPILSNDTLFDPKAIFIQNNSFKSGIIQQSKDQSRLISSGENYLQVWQTDKRKKLHDFSFNNKTVCHLDHTGRCILLIESNKQKNWDDFSLKVLDLETGLTHNKSYTDMEYGDFSFSANSQCVSKPFDDSTTSFICANGSSKLWEINSRTLNIRLLKDYKVEAFDETIIENVYSKANSDTLYLNTYSYSIDENYNKTGEKWSLLSAYNLKTNEEISLPGIRNENTVFQYGQSLIYQEHNSIQILNFTSKKSKKIKLPKNFKLQTTTTSNENIYLALEDRSAMDSSIVFVLNKNTLQKEIELKLPYGAVFFNDKYGIGYEDDDQLYTNYPIRNRSIAWKNDKSLFTQDDDISYTTDGLLLYKNEWLLNLATLEIEGQFPSFYSSVLFSQLGKNMLLQIEKNAHIEGEEKPHYTINIYDIASKKIVWKSEKQALQSIYSGPNKIVLSPGEKYALVYENSLFGDATYGLLLNMDTKEITELKNKYEFNIIAFSKDEKLLTLSSKEKAIQIITATGEKQKAQAPTNSDTRVQFEGQFVELITNGKSTRYYARQYLRAVNYLPDSKLIVAGSESGNLLFWTLDKKSPEKIIEIGSAPVLTIYRNGNKLFVLMRNSEIKIIDLRSLSLDATISFFEKDDDVSLVWYTPQGFFKADKRDIRNFHFVKGLVPYPLINYEVLLNRPDTLMAQLGYTEEALQRIYKDAYLKRLKRNGIPSSQDFLTQDRPQIHLINEDKILPLVDNSQVFLKVRLSAKDNTKTLLKTYINGVKINEKPMTDEQVYTIPITLSQGENIVSIIANDNGIESDPISLEIYNNTPPVELRVHYIGIGVSDYQDSSMNLQYADKDVRTMATFLKGKYSEKIRIDTLTNKAATRENILSLKAVLKSTRVDDIVIVAFSGHGLLDTQQNFYFATHDVIFADPEVNGISYDDLVSLLDDIPARKKLLLIDACHSGEIDSEEDLKITEFTNSHVSESTPKGVLIGEADGSQGGLNTSFDLMKSLFYDTDRGNGSFVISAAGGKEFAYEDEKWGNGVFTYSIINAMSELSYDVWRGTQGIKISQLKIEVYKQVEDLTNGRQKPTSRAENVEWDWEL